MSFSSTGGGYTERTQHTPVDRRHFPFRTGTDIIAEPILRHGVNSLAQSRGRYFAHNVDMRRHGLLVLCGEVHDLDTHGMFVQFITRHDNTGSPGFIARVCGIEL